MSKVQISYDTPVSITCTIAGLSNNTARQSTVIDNHVTLYDDILIGPLVGFKTASGSLGTNPAVNIWVSGSDDGTNFGGSNGAYVLGGGDASFTMPSNKANLALLESVAINSSAAAEQAQVRSLAAVFGGTLPRGVVIIIENQTGLALDATAGGTLQYQGVWYTNQ